MDMNTVTEILTNFANLLGVTVEYLWDTLIKQQFVIGIQNLIMGVIYVAIIFLIIKYIPKIIKRCGEKKRILEEDRINNGYPDISTYEENCMSIVPILAIICSVVISLILIVTAISCINSGIKMLINPEYYAFQELLRGFTR